MMRTKAYITQHMRKFSIIFTLICSIYLLVACQTPPEIQWLTYPDYITEDKPFTVEGEYLTVKAGDEILRVVLNVRNLETHQSVFYSEQMIQNTSQKVTFSKVLLNEANHNVYFELQLFGKGNLIQRIDTRLNPTYLANWHTNIITTYFSPVNSFGEPALGTWGNDLTQENPFFFALPYRDFYYYVWDFAQGKKILTKKDYYGISDVKNRWIEIYYPKADRYCYAQWEDVGPWNYYDPYYVFGTNDERPYAEIGIDMGWHKEYGYRETNGAGLDISPVAMNYLTEGTSGKITVNWRFISADQVPNGPWMQRLSKSRADSEVLNLETQTLRTVADSAQDK